MDFASGRHFLQIPGPTNIPDRILRAIGRPIIDHRGPGFASLGHEVLDGLRPIFKTGQPVIIYPASGSGAWEAALVNTMSPGDKVLMCETGHFAVLWQQIAHRLGIDTDIIETDWRHGAEPAAIGEALTRDAAHEIKGVCI
ncbi:MAG: aminotransferase class V-fold PLP-dependent enzyme, partial [Proteobacteria bacterium]|nr:aminotransferase class V-fold PLP-dependent enzyme [Pseudomonadota bacterium]